MGNPHLTAKNMIFCSPSNVNQNDLKDESPPLQTAKGLPGAPTASSSFSAVGGGGGGAGPRAAAVPAQRHLPGDTPEVEFCSVGGSFFFSPPLRKTQIKHIIVITIILGRRGGGGPSTWCPFKAKQNKGWLPFGVL